MIPQKQIDWADVRRRLDAVHAASEPGTQALAHEKRILHDRAHDLALEPQALTAARDTLSVVVFDLFGERYAIELLAVREVCALKELTPVPCTPEFVLGIINLRGEIHTVIDLKRFFDLPAGGLTELNKILILESGAMRLGILADAIHGVSAILLSDIQPTLPTLTGIRADFLRGVTKERLIVLDAAKILADGQLVQEAAED